MTKKTLIFGAPIVGLAWLVAASWPAAADKKEEKAKIEVVCPTEIPPVPKIGFRDVYKDVPFKAGEQATYEVTWMDIKAGYGTMEVRSPRKHNDVFHRVYHANASTGDWFKTIFVAKDKIESISRPWDFGVAKFYMSQDEGTLFRSFKQKKWLEFNHDTCKVTEKIKEEGKKEKNRTHDLSPGAIDALGVIYYLRTLDYKVGEVQRAPVFTSEKNWWLDAMPVAEETLEVPAGKFKAMKLKLQTFIGKELQQKGDVFAWVATEAPERPIVQIQGEIKIGSVWIKLHKFKAGR